jgi:hypothetical protein
MTRARKRKNSSSIHLAHRICLIGVTCLAFIIIIMALPDSGPRQSGAQSGRVTYHVAPAGSDSDSDLGSEAKPLSTIHRAAEMAEAGDMVLVDGVHAYVGPNDCFGRVIAHVSRSGVAGKPIALKPKNRWSDENRWEERRSRRRLQVRRRRLSCSPPVFRDDRHGQ